ncbi:hypothetical protein M1329_00505, partial [Candidatus Marsarchaeota archaeon]|nr:hypothetical protein [Candidatus Marsarchaeota archaeon]
RERYQLNDFILYQLTGTGRSSIYDKNVPIADLAGEVKRLEVMLREDDILHVKVFLDEAIDQFWRYLAIERKG